MSPRVREDQSVKPSGKDRTVLITGASAGIGYELTRCFAEAGYQVVLVSRNEARLREFAVELEKKYGISARVIAKDLSDPRGPAELFIELQQEQISIDILVNNAGFGGHGLFSKTSLTDELDMIQLNIASLTHLTKLFLREMLKRREGRILNVASTAAFLPGPLMAVYYATKAYVLSFSEALAEELRGSGVTVTCLCPGPTISEFQKRANVGDDILLMKGRLMDSKAVARIGYRGLMKGRRVIIAGFGNRLLVGAAKFAPRSLVTRMIKFLQITRRGNGNAEELLAPKK